jgi:aryl-alcohol dehydrogenase-like predicted oxidoreductase
MKTRKLSSLKVSALGLGCIGTSASSAASGAGKRRRLRDRDGFPVIVAAVDTRDQRAACDAG